MIGQRNFFQKNRGRKERAVAVDAEVGSALHRLALIVSYAFCLRAVIPEMPWDRARTRHGGFVPRHSTTAAERPMNVGSVPGFHSTLSCHGLSRNRFH